MIVLKRFFLSAFILSVLAAPAIAKDSMNVEAAVKMQELMNEITQGLNEADRAHFFTMFQHHNLMTLVDVTKQDVEKAMQSCGEHNPEMKEEASDTLALWKEDVEAKQKEANAYILRMIYTQGYVPPQKVKKLFKYADALRAHKDTHFSKVPVTKPKACRYLMSKMTETREDLLALMDSVMVDLPLDEENAVNETQEDGGEQP